MRQRLNQNPIVQVVLIGFLAIVVGLMFMTRVISSDEPAAESPPAIDPATGAVSTAPATDALAPAASADPAAAPIPSPQAARTAFKAGPGLPKPLVQAYDGGDTVALLITKRKGIDDERMRKLAAGLDGRAEVTLIRVKASAIGRYSRIAEGAGLNRVPALIVIQPKRLADGGLPTASVSYGVRGPESISQTLRDALYKGKSLPYHPR